MLKKYAAHLLILVALLAMAGCAKPVETESESVYYKSLGDEYFAEKKYRNAISSYENALARAESPEEASLIQLSLANSYFLSKQYLDAIPVYEVYLDYYGESAEADLALLRIGLAHFNLMRRASQDQTQTVTALSYFEKVKARNPAFATEYNLDEKIAEIRKKLADKEYIIARYYGRILEYRPSMLRYKYLVDNYPDSPRYELSAYKLVKLLLKLNDVAEAENYFTLIKMKFPESKHIKEIEKDFVNTGIRREKEKKQAIIDNKLKEEKALRDEKLKKEKEDKKAKKEAEKAAKEAKKAGKEVEKE